MKESLKSFYKNNFVFKGKEKLSKLTILFIITLDLFIFAILNMGIDFQVQVLNSPNSSYPNQCRTIVNSKDIHNINKYFYTSRNTNHKYQNIKDEQITVVCKNLFDKLNNVKTEHNINILRKQEKKLLKELGIVSKELEFIRSNYNTSLFESIENSTNINDSKTLVNSEIKEKYIRYTKLNENLKQKKQKLLNDFKNSKSIKEFILYIKENKKSINNGYKTLKKSYEINKELITLAFLSPLLLISFYLMRSFLQKENYILYVISKNILVVILIPTFVSFISLVYTLLPKIFFEKLLKFFINLEIPFVVYYFAIAILVLIFTYIIIKIQKRYKKDGEEFINNSISKLDSYNRSICNSCGNKVNYETMNYCPNCQNQLRVDCPSCNSKTIKSLKYCICCSKKVDLLNT